MDHELLVQACGRWGVQTQYRDINGSEQHASDDALFATLLALGAGESQAGPSPTPVWVVRERDRARTILPACTLIDEENVAHSHMGDAVPRELLNGYYRVILETNAGGADLSAHEAALQELILVPNACPTVSERGWGWALQLYALRSDTSAGVGDLGVLREFGAIAKQQGASFTLINPLHAPPLNAPGTAMQPSPYFAGSRLFRNPLFLDVVEMLEHHKLDEQMFGADVMERLARVAKVVNNDPKLDRDAAWDLKRLVIDTVWGLVQTQVEAEVQREIEHTPYLREYAVYCVLCELHGPAWADWPFDLRECNKSIVDIVAAEYRDRWLYHAWLQVEILRQLRLANDVLPVVSDLAVGTDPQGGDAWLWPSMFARGMRIGAPPDPLAWAGQDWGIAPFNPNALRDSCYRPFVALVRSAMQGTSGLRIDHVMGLFRLYWIAPNFNASDGVYVSYPWWDLLGIVALEATRAGCFVVGEDLGTVEDGVRDTLRERNAMSYRLLLFATPDEVKSWPSMSLAAFGTHDLPTIAGIVRGTDEKQQRVAGVKLDLTEIAAMRDRVCSMVKLDSQAGCDVSELDAIEAVYRQLALAPSVLVTATVDDGFAAPDRANMPGTVDEWPNWRVALPGTLGDFANAPATLRIVRAMKARTRRP